ncbi:Dabb family protein [Neolewinella persica]|uniref:Dabb family protein n=1 Tax=Neolewinella persica TaxID=70998 RepID=UPI0003793023|nr:Dabb family protein [Neolewinella persica]
MKYLFFALPLFLLSCSSEPAPETTQETTTDLSVDMAAAAPDSLLRHVVMFSFNEESYPDGVAEVEQAFIDLADKIPQIHDFEWGTNNSPEGLDKGLTHIFFVTFKSEADRAVYLPHPDHQAFVELLGPHLKDVLVLDYWTK